MAGRQSITREFLWLAVLAGGPLLGAKLFDLVVLAGAWSAHPPASLAMMPYGKAWPVDIGVFFIPLSAAIAFWPMNAALFYHGVGSDKDTITDAQSIAMTRRWVTLDWVRVAGATAAFVAPLRALTLPWPQQMVPKDPPVIRFLLTLALVAVATFVIWFVHDL